jgi:hypothetical protein
LLDSSIFTDDKDWVRIEKHFFDYRDTLLRIQRHFPPVRGTLYPFFKETDHVLAYLQSFYPFEQASLEFSSLSHLSYHFILHHLIISSCLSLLQKMIKSSKI